MGSGNVVYWSEDRDCGSQGHQAVISGSLSKQFKLQLQVASWMQVENFISYQCKRNLRNWQKQTLYQGYDKYINRRKTKRNKEA